MLMHNAQDDCRGAFLTWPLRVIRPKGRGAGLVSLTSAHRPRTTPSGESGILARGVLCRVSHRNAVVRAVENCLLGAYLAVECAGSKLVIREPVQQSWRGYRGAVELAFMW
jgi:hypothetical protein